MPTDSSVSCLDSCATGMVAGVTTIAIVIQLVASETCVCACVYRCAHIESIRTHLPTAENYSQQVWNLHTTQHDSCGIIGCTQCNPTLRRPYEVRAAAGPARLGAGPRFLSYLTGLAHHKRPWSVCKRARHCERLVRCLLRIRDQSGYYAVTEQEKNSSDFTNRPYR